MTERDAPLRRPWQVAARWMGQPAVSPGLAAELGRILDLLPGVGHLEVQTTHGRIMVTRDFPSDIVPEVDGILARAFRDNPEVTGILFPAGTPRPAHIATPAEPFSPHLDRLAAETVAAGGQRDATPEKLDSQRVQLGRPGAAVSELPDGRWFHMYVGPPPTPPTLVEGRLPINHVIVGASLFGWMFGRP